MLLVHHHVLCMHPGICCDPARGAYGSSGGVVRLEWLEGQFWTERCNLTLQGVQLLLLLLRCFLFRFLESLDLLVQLLELQAGPQIMSKLRTVESQMASRRSAHRLEGNSNQQQPTDHCPWLRSRRILRLAHLGGNFRGIGSWRLIFLNVSATIRES